MGEQPKLTPTQAKVVKAKVEAELADIPQAVAAQKVFPNQTPGAASVSMSRELKKANVQEALQAALERHNLTPDRIMSVVGDAMDAEKEIVSDGEIISTRPDHSIRLKAAGMAAQFMGIGKSADGGTSIHFHQHVAEQRDKYGI